MKQTKHEILSGFSRLARLDKIRALGNLSPGLQQQLERGDEEDAGKMLSLLQQISENVIASYSLSYSIAPNFLVNDSLFHVPMVTEESSVVAAASKAAKFWAPRGGFHAEVISMLKTGQVHFAFKGSSFVLMNSLEELSASIKYALKPATRNMEARGGGIRDISLVDKTAELEDYYQLFIKFDTRDAMGANFINSCMEEAAGVLVEHIVAFLFQPKPEIIMAVLSNHVPESLVRVHAQCMPEQLVSVAAGLPVDDFIRKYEKAIRIADVDPYRAATNNKGIFNGIDAVAMSTGNDIRAVEVAGHSYASGDRGYKGLSWIDTSDGKFTIGLTMPLAVGTVGGLTGFHPMAEASFEILNNPDVPTLMGVMASVGLASNFAAVSSLITSGIQAGHMKLHLANMLHRMGVSEEEKEQVIREIGDQKISYRLLEELINKIRSKWP